MNFRVILQMTPLFPSCRLKTHTEHDPIGIGLILPEDIDHKFQADVLDLRVEACLPFPALGSQGIGIGAGSEVTQLQVIVELETLRPARAHTETHRA